MDVKTRWNWTQVLLERAYRLCEFMREWLKNPKYRDHWPLFTSQDEWTIVKYIMEVLRPFQYWTLWMLKRHTVTLHQVITVYNEMVDHIDGMMRALAKKKTQWKEDLYFAVKFARQKLSKYFTEVTPTTGMLLISAHILDPFWMLRSFRKWDKIIYINPEDEISYPTQYQQAFLKYVDNEYCTKHWRLPVTKPDSIPNNNPVSSAMASRLGQSSYDPYDLYCDDEEYLICNNVAKTTPGRGNRSARVLKAAKLYRNSPPELPPHWGLINLNLNDYHSDPMEISSIFWLPDITDWWGHQEETHSKYADRSNVARDIFSIIHYGVGVEASISLGRDVFGWKQSKTTGKTHRETIFVKQFARTNDGSLAGKDPVLDPTSTDNNMEMKSEVKQKKLHRMAKVHNFLEMWQGSQNREAK